MSTSEKFYTLESVGTIVNDDGMTYPLFYTQVDGKPTPRDGAAGKYQGDDDGIHVEDIDSGDWWDALSIEDTKTVLSIYKKNSYFKGIV